MKLESWLGLCAFLGFVALCSLGGLSMFRWEWFRFLPLIALDGVVGCAGYWLVANPHLKPLAALLGMLTVLASFTLSDHCRSCTLELRLPATEGELVSDFRLLLLPVVVGLWGLTQETYETFRCLSGYFGEQWDRAAQMGISLVWTLCGVLLLIAGIVRQFQPIRLLALGLFGLMVTKVFLFDLGFLDTSYRILSFGGLGLALIGISWLYSRYGRLRG
jgi:hypothetical protein